MRSLWYDIIYSARSLTKSPGFTLIAVFTVALGIGANTAMFSAVYAVLFKPLPYNDPARLFLLWEDSSVYGSPKDTPAVANYFDWQEQSRSFESMAAISTDTMNLSGSDEPEQLGVATVTANFFSVLGVVPQIGRSFINGEDQEGKPAIAVLGHRLWQRRFGADTNVIGRGIVLDGRPFQIVGVMPPSFTFPAQAIDLWIPFQFNAGQRNNRSDHYLWVTGRLKEGVSPTAAQAEMTTIAASLQKAFPETNTNIGCNIESLREYYAGDVRPVLLTLMAAVGLVLLVACANVASLMLARSACRSRELFVRVALGAERSQLVRLTLVESLLVAAIGTMFGIILAAAVVYGLDAVQTVSLGELGNATLSLPVLVFAVGLSLLTSALFGLLPAWQASRINLATGLKEGSRSLSGGSGRVRSLLVAGEVALSLCLLIGAGGMLRTLVALRSAPLGFQPSGAIVVSTPLGGEKYRAHDARVRFLQQVLEKVNTLPGVEAAGYTSHIPLTFGGDQNSFQVEGRPVPPPGQQDIGPVRVVTPGYFQAVGTLLISGRSFDSSDVVDSPRVVVVNQTFARKFWPGEDAVGKRIQRGSAIVEGAWLNVIGVVQDTPQVSVERETKIEIYLPYTQFRGYFFVPRDLVVRTAAAPLALAPAVRDAVHAVDKDQPVTQPATLEDKVASALGQRRLQSWLFTSFAAIALILAAVGLFGVLSQLVAHREREFGIRMALGAKAGAVVVMVLGEAFALVGVGSVAGILGYLAVARFLSSLLFEVSATDPMTIVAVIGVLIAVALLASVVPAWRATRVDPMVVLRDQ